MKGGSGVTTDWYKTHKHVKLLAQQKLLKIQEEFLSLLGMTELNTSPVLTTDRRNKRNKEK